jgi:hypothetical protein
LVWFSFIPSWALHPMTIKFLNVLFSQSVCSEPHLPPLVLPETLKKNDVANFVHVNRPRPKYGLAMMSWIGLTFPLFSKNLDHCLWQRIKECNKCKTTSHGSSRLWNVSKSNLCNQINHVVDASMSWCLPTVLSAASFQESSSSNLGGLSIRNNRSQTSIANIKCCHLILSILNHLTILFIKSKSKVMKFPG